ncbi:MAG: hypothetical protein E7314_07370 [Clostridiales bacterium]|nr:hypothetical protein [Clostridiales bacterium]
MKKFDFKSMLVGIITGSLLFGGIVGANTLITGKIYLSSHAINVDGKAYKAENPLLNYEGTTYVPLREFGTITGSTVSFKDGTITVKRPTGTTTTNPSTNTGTSTGTTSSTTSLNGTKITIEEGDTDSFYVDLKAANAKSATVTITSGTAYAKLSKTSLTASGLVTVTGQKEGSAIIKVTYSTGKSDVITVKVEGTDEIEIDVGDYEYIEIDLDEYDADEAELSITSGSTYIKLDKTKVTSDTDVKVTGKKAGEATVKVKYDSGDTVYYDFIVTGSSSASDEIKVELAKNSKFIYYIDLDEYDADEADIYLDDDAEECLGVTLGSSTKVTSSKTTTSSKTLTIEGKATGSGEIEIEFDTGDILTISVDVMSKTKFDFDYYYDESEYDFEIDKGDWDTLEIDPDDYDADWATISVIAGHNCITAYETFVDEETEVDIDGDAVGDAVIQVTYSTRDIEYYYVEVVD